MFFKHLSILLLLLLTNTVKAKTQVYHNLSDQFNISISIKPNATNNPEYDSLYVKVEILDKETNAVRQTIRKKTHIFWLATFATPENVRSYQTGINSEKEVVDGGFGDLVIADLNFDGLDDIAIAYDWGVSNGPHYYFYMQKPDGLFFRNVYLCERMSYFPHKIDIEKQQLTTLTHANAYQVGKRVYQYNSENKSWYLKSQELLGD